MFSRHTAGGLLAHIVGRAAIFAEPTAYVALFITAPSDDSGTGAAEPSGAGYARQATGAASWNPATAPPSRIGNAATIVFPTATADWGTIVAAGLYDAASGGNLLAWDWLGAFLWQPCTISAASPAAFDLPGNGFAVGDEAIFTTVFGGVAPALAGGSGALGGTTPSAVASAAGDSVTLTTGGTAVATTGTGNGMLRKFVPQSVPQGVTMTFAAGALALQTDREPMPLSARGGARARGAAATALLMQIQGRATVIGAAQDAITTGGGAGFILGTGTSGTDALGTGTGSSDLLGVQ